MQIIFFHNPKVAGESLRQLMPDGTLFIGHDYYHPQAQHLYYDTQRYLQKFVIAFVRNPYDRVVSAFHYLNAGGNNDSDKADRDKYIAKYNGDFEEFVENAFPDVMNQIHFMQQYRWIYQNNVSLCNFIGKYETLQDDLEILSEVIKLKSIKLPELNTSEHKPYKEYYTEKTRNIIYNMYYLDFVHFDYGKEL